MIIGIDISQIVYSTGVSRYTKELVRHLLRIDRDNHYKLFAGVFRLRTAIDSFFDELKAEKLSFTPVVTLFPPKIAQLVWNQWQVFPVEWFLGRLDIWHASNWTFPKTQAKKVATIHDLTPILYPQYHTEAIISAFKRHLSLATAQADAIITDSQSSLRDLTTHTHLDQTKIKAIPLAASEAFSPVTEENMINQIKEKYHLPQRYLLTVATKEPRKNLATLIDAFKQLALTDISLVLVGKQGWGEQVDYQGNSIIETGFVSDEDLPVLYSQALGFIYISEYEGFGLPVLEAMKCGCPVITSNCSSLPEVAGEAGLLVNPHDLSAIKEAIKKIVTNDDFRTKLKEKSREEADKFSWEKTARETLKVYQSLYNH